MTIRSATLFPQALLPLFIFEPRYRRMLANTLRGGRMFCVAMQRPDRRRETPCAVAGLGLIRASVEHPDGTSHLVLQGLVRVEVREAIQQKPYPIHAIRPLPAPPADSVAIDALVAKVHELVEQRMQLGELPFPLPLSKKSAHFWDEAGCPPTFSICEVLDHLRRVSDGGQLADLVSCALLPEALQRQSILEAVEVAQRLRRLIHFLMAQIRQHPNNLPG